MALSTSNSCRTIDILAVATLAEVMDFSESSPPYLKLVIKLVQMSFLYSTRQIGSAGQKRGNE